LAATSARAVVINNGIPAGTLNHWEVDVVGGGEAISADLTAQRFAAMDIVTEDIIFDYFSYVDVGAGGFQLSSFVTMPPALTGVNEVTSSGSFLGAGGNTINWSVVSTIANGDSRFVNQFSFATANGSPLGSLRLYQYLDEDIEGVGDDVFLVRGSVAGQDLELFTIDNDQVYGVSHSGALTGAQGLVNASFAGWAADNYNDMKPKLAAGTQAVAPAGVIDASLIAINHPQVGDAYGPADIVSVLAWDVNAASSSATIITTLGGVPEAEALQAPDVENAFVSALVGESVMHTFVGMDPDGDAAALVWGNFVFNGPGAALQPMFDPDTQELVWDTTGSLPGIYTATVTATDPDMLSDSGTLTIDLTVPEPATWTLLTIAGVMASLGVRKRR
jgi:hypothetical protein